MSGGAESGSLEEQLIIVHMGSPTIMIANPGMNDIDNCRA